MHPITVMVTGPPPGFVALPIPAAVSPYPLTVAVRTPADGYVNRVPASAIGADAYPGAIRRKWLIEI